MGDYSFQKNLQYMGMAFVKPGSAIEGFIQETSIAYGIVPFVLTKGLYEILFFWDYFRKTPIQNKLLPFSDSTYHLIRAFFAPLAEIALILWFAGVLYLFAKQLGCHSFDVRKTTSFFMFTFATHLVVVAVDIIYYFYPYSVLLFIHGLAGFVTLAYLTAFIHKLTDQTVWRSFAVVLPAWMAYFFTRLLFFWV